MGYPVVDITRSALLTGQQNGRLPESILVVTKGQAGGPDVRLIKPAAMAWQAMCAAAKTDEIILKASGPSDSFRPYEVQERIFRQRYTTKRLPGRPSRVWNGLTWWQLPNTAAAAVPGTSNHGWGQAVDTGVESDGDPGTESISAPAIDWLLRNAKRFGWSWELDSEPWHLHYFAGDRLPDAVAAYHGPTAPKPDAASDEEEDVPPKIVYLKDPRSANPAAYVDRNGRLKYISSLEALAAAKFLYPEGNRDTDPVDAVLQSLAEIIDGPCKNVG